MSSARITRSSVLGKRSLQHDQCRPHTPSSDRLLTPDPTPKRSRTSPCVLDNDGNKENVPPFRIDTLLVNPSRTRRTRRPSSETPSRQRPPARRHASSPTILSQSSPETPSTTATSPISPPPSPPPKSPPTPVPPIHARARALLRATCNGSFQIAERDKERAQILDFVTSFESKDVPTTLYISGLPGSGKTALVNSVLDKLDSSDLKVISINCMALNGTDALWERLLEEIDDKKKSRTKQVSGQEAVERVLSNMKTKCITVLDELDHIVSSPSSLLSLLSLSKSASKNFRIIGIANTHTLSSSTSASSPIQTLHFAPYTSAQLLSILKSRLAPLWDVEDKEEANKFLPQSTMVLLTKKVAGMTGDVRALFEVLRGGIDKALAASTPSDAPSDSQTSHPPPTVSPSHILAALKSYAPAGSATNATGAPSISSSEIVAKVKNLGLQARLVFLSILLATRRLEAGLTLTPLSGASSPPPTPSKSPAKRSSQSASPPAPTVSVVDAAQLHGFYVNVLGRAEGGLFTHVGRSEFTDLLGMLEGVGLVSLSTRGGIGGAGSPTKGGKRTLSRSTSFGPAKTQGQTQEVRLVQDLRVDEALRGLGIGLGVEVANVKEEEVKAIWERELVRLTKELKTKGNNDNGNSHDVLNGAVED